MPHGNEKVPRGIYSKPAFLSTPPLWVRRLNGGELLNMNDRGLLTIAVAGLTLAVVGTTVGIPGLGNLNAAGDGSEPAEGEVREFNTFKETVGIEFPAQTASETFVLIPTDVDPENYGEADVTSIGADGDENDDTELFGSDEVTEGEDYYVYNAGDTKMTADIPNSGDFKLAAIGAGVVNEYRDVTIPETVQTLRIEQGTPVTLADDEEATAYAADADVTNTDTRVEDGDSTIALSGDFSSTNDADVDGSVTLVDEYEIAQERAVSFGELSVGSVSDSVDEITATVVVDGEQVESVTDSDFSDAEGLDDGVEFGQVVASDSVEVRTQVEFDDNAVSTATGLATVTLDDTDEDGVSADGSYGITALSTTLTGY